MVSLSLAFVLTFNFIFVKLSKVLVSGITDCEESMTQGSTDQHSLTHLTLALCEIKLPKRTYSIVTFFNTNIRACWNPNEKIEFEVIHNSIKNWCFTSAPNNMTMASSIRTRFDISFLKNAWKFNCRRGALGEKWTMNCKIFSIINFNTYCLNFGQNQS